MKKLNFYEDYKGKKVMRVIFLILLLLPSFHLFPSTLSERFLSMGTIVEIKIKGSFKKPELRSIMRDTRAYMESLSILLNSYDPRSEVSRINNATEGEKVKVSPLTYDILKDSIEMSRLTEGSFDITVLPLVSLWGFFKKGRKIPPSSSEIEKVIPEIGYYYLKIFPSYEVMKQKEGVKITLSGIAKGYIVDKAIDFLKRERIESALVNAGGDLRVFGKRWRIGVANPRNPEKVVGIINLREGAVTTSGDYRKYWIYKGKRYSHIIDPLTGYPSSSGVISATVISPNCWRADALATALVVRGEEGFSWLGKKESALLIKEKEGKIQLIYSPRMKRYFRKSK